MDRTRLLVGLASVFVGTAAVLAVAGLVANPLFVVFAVPFALAAYLVWADVTGHLARRFRARRARRGAGGRSRTRGRSPAAEGTGDPSRAEARRVLGVDPGADEAAIRRAYRDRVKAVHPDADGGDEEAFKRVTAAYERLRE